MGPPRLCYVFGRFRLDSVDKALLQDEQPVPLTPKAIDTLLALVARHGRLVTKEELLQLVWPDAFVEENNLAQNISTLRRVLGEGAGGERFIETVPKRGYRFVAPVTESLSADDIAGVGVAPERLTSPPAAVADAAAVVAPAPRSGRRATMWGAIAATVLALIVVAASR